MSAIDDFAFNQKLQFQLMAPLEIDDPDRQEKSLNGSPALSHRQLVSLLKLFKLNDVNLRDLNNLDHIWAVYQGLRRDPATKEFKRDQISILINIGNTHTTRIYIRPLRNGERETRLLELEALRGPAQLMNYLGDLSQATITRRGGSGGNRTFTPRNDQRKPGGHKDEGARHRPFQDLHTKFEAHL